VSDGSDCSVRSYNINHDGDTQHTRQQGCVCVRTDTKDSRLQQNRTRMNLTKTSSGHIRPQIRSK